MPRKRTGRSTNDGARRRTNGGVPSIHVATREQSVSPSPHLRDPRWATPVRRRADVFVVDIARPNRAASSPSDDDSVLLSA
jgi:hypothetical protein